MKLCLEIEKVKGYLSPHEGQALYRHAIERSVHGPCVEIGSYCGKSTVYLGSACRATDGILFAIDHHRGSEENQPGWDYHDAELWDDKAEAIDTLPFFRRTINEAGLEGWVVPIVGNSKTVSRHWQTTISLLFIDGGHTIEHAQNDLNGWAPHLMENGILAIHDVFPDPKDGGRPPFEIYQEAIKSGCYREIEAVESLRVLQRL